MGHLRHGFSRNRRLAVAAAACVWPACSAGGGGTSSGPGGAEAGPSAYATSFDDASVLSDWRLEGGGRMAVENGSLVLENRAAAEPADVPGRHLVCWLDREMPADFLLEFSVQPRDRHDGLAIVFFNARGRDGVGVFDPALKPRDGSFPQYHSGDIDNYHISYWAGSRGTVHLRKNRGFVLCAEGRDLVAPAPAAAFQTVQVIKRGGTIRLLVDGAESLAFEDDGKAHGPVHAHPGWIGLRQMAHTGRCEYGFFRVFPLKR